MEAFAVIIPDRGDRSELFNHCMKQVERFTTKPKYVIPVTHNPTSIDFDIIPRILIGIDKANKLGIDLCFIIESDDYYPANYFDRFSPYFEKHDFFGDEATTYYNLRNLTHNKFNHPYRSSLFTTGFKISALNNFDWPELNNPFLDIPLWKYGRHKRRKFIETGAIGMKHALGLCGGKGHKMTMKNQDPNMYWLKARVDSESFEFYKAMNEKLTMQKV